MAQSNEILVLLLLPRGPEAQKTHGSKTNATTLWGASGRRIHTISLNLLFFAVLFLVI